MQCPPIIGIIEVGCESLHNIDYLKMALYQACHPTTASSWVSTVQITYNIMLERKKLLQ